MAKLLFTPPATFNVEEASRLVWKLFGNHDLVTTHARWGEVFDTESIGTKLSEIFTTHFTVKNKTELKRAPERAAWPEDLAEKFFPGEALLFGASGPDQEAARDRVMGLLWEYASTSLSSPLNIALSAMDSYVVLQTKVAKKRPGPGMVGIPIAKDARFVSKDKALIQEMRLSHEVEKWRRSTTRLEGELKEIAFRLPELAVPNAKLVNAQKPSVMEILVHADPAAVAEMYAAPDGEDADEGDADDYSSDD